MLCNRALFRHGLYEVRVLALPLEALGFGGSPLCDFFFGSGTAAGAVADIVEVPKCGCLEITVCHIWIGKTGLFLIWLDGATIQFRFLRPSSFNTALQLVLRPHFLVHFV
jgi:hypothetical protein